jgi:Tfp pilus assembly protein PilX
MAITLEAGSWKLEAGKKRGFALLVAVIFMSVMLSFGLALGSLGYKQQVLASSATESQYAFYAADAALECALYADQRQNLFDYSSHDAARRPNSIVCDGAPATELSYSYSAGVRLVVSERLSLDSTTSRPRCADVTIYKPAPGSGLNTYIFSQGYDVSCATMNNLPSNARFVSRGIQAHY